MKLFLSPSALLIAALLGSSQLFVGCGGGDASGPVAATSVASAPVTGVFLDAAVEGLDYTAGTSAKARTNAKGEFICKDTDSVSLLDEDGDPSNGIKLTPAVKALLNSRTDRHPGAAARCLQGPYG